MIDAKGVAFAYGEREIVRDFSLRVHRGDRIAIVGPNGAGKTTLLKLLTGKLVPQKGNVKLGQGLLMGELDQNRSKLHPEQSLAAAVTDGSGDTVMVAGKPRHVMNYLQDFLFTPQQARTPVKVLSGGERARLLLAKLFATPSNFLVLDEPTNDLDLETLDLLEEVIADYPGTALLVSHDRDFLDRVATQIVLAEGDGRFTEYAGGYGDMLVQRGDKPPQRPESRERKPGPPAEKRARASAPKDEFFRPARPQDAARKNSSRGIAHGGAGAEPVGWFALCPRSRQLHETVGGIGGNPRPKRRRRGTLAGAGNGARGAGTGAG